MSKGIIGLFMLVIHYLSAMLVLYIVFLGVYIYTATALFYHGILLSSAPKAHL
jgi:hypothetical protein